MKRILKPRTTKWNKCGTVEDTQADLRRWYAGLPGSVLLEIESQLLEDILPNLFGYHLLKVGLSFENTALAASRIPHKVVLDWDVIHTDSSEIAPSAVTASSDALPIVADGLDVIVLSHSLEFAANPHQVLREVERCLIPDGHVVITGFNPVGLWMIWRLLLGWREKPPWCGRFIRPARMRDWLQLLGFDVIDCRYYFYRPPISREGALRKLEFMERLGGHWWTRLSGAYIMVAQKREATLTPIKPRWRARRRRVTTHGLAGSSSVAPTTNSTSAIFPAKQDKNGQ